MGRKTKKELAAEAAAATNHEQGDVPLTESPPEVRQEADGAVSISLQGVDPAALATALGGTLTSDDATPTSEVTSAEPAADPAPSAAEPEAPVVITFARPPVEVEGEIRAEVAAGKDLVAIRAYKAWANGREGVGAEGGPESVDLLVAQDAVRWLLAQPPIEPPPPEEPVPGEAAPDRTHLRLVTGGSAAAPAPEGGQVVARIVPPARTKVLVEKIINHAFTLTDTDLLARGDELAQLEAKIEEATARHAEVKRQMKTEMNGLTGARAQVADVIRKREEVRKVQVIEVADYHDGVIRVIDTATDIVIDTRQMEGKERQMSLFGSRPAVQPEAPPVEVEHEDPADEPEDYDGEEDEDEDEENGDGEENDE